MVKVPDFRQARVLIVGDVMLDRYWHGSTSRISPEAPVPVVHIKKNEDRPGGAGNVALNVRSLGATASLLGLIGDDEAGKILQDQLEGAKIQGSLLQVDMPTVTKLRVISRHQQLIRLDFEEPPIEDQHFEGLFEKYEALINEADAVIFSDYNKGALRRLPDFIKVARQANVPIFIDPKYDDVSIYRGATLLTPNFKEFESVVGPCRTEEEIVQKGRALLKKYELEALLVTRGERGMTLLREGKPELHVPTRAKEVFDVTGAGDTVIATLAAAVAGGAELDDAVVLANAAAGISVGKLGAATVSLPELCGSLHNHQGEPAGVMTEEQLLLAVQEARSRGDRVVMTNGCFDILHAGHVHYLEQAKQHGDLLIVAVNDDASVKQLKGAGRPVNSLEKRMVVLSGLGAVDWVVAFSEDTPERLIKAVTPDVLVKGGDYKVEEIAGSDHVLKNGGKVEILGFVEGLSTTSLINKIHQDLEGDEE
jgi:D-beta-D-heptose 7-phosphate kinase / D-beta-D-heptose 1-phosphate adenosyltransferase